MHHKRIACGLLAALVSCAWAAVNTDVSQLTHDTFDDFIESNNLVLTEFYASWCGHCKALAPEYEEAAASLRDKNIKLAKVDCDEEPDLCKKYDVKGYPTLKAFRGLENISPYTGQRNAAAIASYMIKHSRPAVSVLTKDTLMEFKTAEKIVIVAYINTNDPASNQTFTKLAEDLRDNYLFGTINDAAVAEAEGVKAPAMIVYKSFDEGKNVFTEKFEKNTMNSFIVSAATPFIGEVDPETYPAYMSAGIPLAYIFSETSEERDEFRDAIRPIAEKYKGKINFATIDAKSFGAHASALNLENKFPSFVIHDIAKNQKFPFDQGKQITHDHIAKFVKTFSEGKLEASIKSEPIPKTQEGPVTVVVAKNYNDIVLDDTKDVLIEFYAHWCGHCKALAPKYEELATQFAASDFKDKVVIAKVDATKNDVPDEVSGYPTIKLYPAGAKDAPVTYQGSRTVEDLANFIKEHGKHKAEPSVKEEATEEDAVATNSEEQTEGKSEGHHEL
ncbi:hypothetical protein LCI18_014491 [Fusarium solani-melongenae]|uniref:Uncharacterized protein n=1 Tax=Fusarium solani subsp. cucurbitae TaxID=2747967 RepID=A0ACD3ZQS5_FUSSC|nr:hypothetical protein LCI18_014491 [Fusarium solani-melongenae]